MIDPRASRRGTYGKWQYFAICCITNRDTKMDPARAVKRHFGIEFACSIGERISTFELATISFHSLLIILKRHINAMINRQYGLYLNSLE